MHKTLYVLSAHTRSEPVQLPMLHVRVREPLRGKKPSAQVKLQVWPVVGSRHCCPDWDVLPPSHTVSTNMLVNQPTP
jgi:hypothetical protein